MCGIAGIIGNTTGSEALLQAMLQRQKHRGPDAMQAVVFDGVAVLGHNRLSIIDLSDAANQPMESAGGRYTIVFNGEIYNYRELKKALTGYVYKTNSDTEVILAAFEKWGIAALPRLNGMFALAIWDNRERKLYAARDRFGVKPFYYALHEEKFYFASEITSLFAAGVPRVMNETVWAGYFAHGSYGAPGETFWQDIQQLPAGHYLQLDASLEIRQEQWYCFEEGIDRIRALNDKHWEEEYRSLLEEAVALRFRADVPVGFNLSGGLDSSTLLAMVHKLFGNKNGIEVFSFTTGHTAYDELPWVKEMLAAQENPLTECRLYADAVPELAWQLSEAQAEPYGGLPTIAYANIFKKARQRGVIVLLDGQGMDEAWAGYDYYLTNSGSLVQGTKSPAVSTTVMDEGFLRKANPLSYPEPFTSRTENLQYRDLFYTKIPRALRFNDRISMMHSTELREPFLDYRLVETAFARPPEDKLKNGQTKWMLRNISTELLGTKLAHAPKRAVQTPQREWLAAELKDWASGWIYRFCDLDWVAEQEVKRRWKQYLAGDNDNSFFVWQWINTAMLLT